jgi:hypothetical protein
MPDNLKGTVFEKMGVMYVLAFVEQFPVLWDIFKKFLPAYQEII